MRRTTYPLSRQAIGPGPGYVRVPLAPHLGRHTGGPWFHPSRPDEYWKPLDCLPYPNAAARCSTQEAVILDAAAYLPMFPRNWRVVTHPERNWLVRRRALTDGFTITHALHLEQGLRAFNRAGFALNDWTIEAAIDRGSGEPFWLDLSCAADERAHPQRADDTTAWLAWLGDHGFAALADLRQTGRSLAALDRLAGDKALAKRLRAYPHRYGSPATAVTIPTGDVQYLAGVAGEPFTTWIFTRQPLAEAVVAAFALTWVWSPIHRHEEQKDAETNGAYGLPAGK